MSIAITTSMTKDDWDTKLSGWRCPPLKIPGATIEALYAESGRIDKAWYEVQPDLTLVRWVHGSVAPPEVTASITLTQELASQDLTQRWKKLAIVLPVAATVVTALIGAGLIPKLALGRKVICDLWTVTGKARLPPGLDSSDVGMSLRPPDMSLYDDGHFQVKIPLETHEDGTVELTQLLFTPRKPNSGYRAQAVYLNPDNKLVVGVERNYSQKIDRTWHTIDLGDPVEFPNTSGDYQAINAQTAVPTTGAKPASKAPLATLQ
jgi:hypothetical protein